MDKIDYSGCLFVNTIKNLLRVRLWILEQKVYFLTEHTHLVQAIGYDWLIYFNLELRLKLVYTVYYLVSLNLLMRTSIKDDSAGNFLFKFTGEFKIEIRPLLNQ